MGVLVSIIVPVKNEAKNIKRFIEGIKKQTYRPIEALFIDGGSTDGTREIIGDMAENLSEPILSIKLLKEEDYGTLRSPANARNIGVRESKGRYIIFFDADFDLSSDEAVIEKVAKALADNEHVAITYEPSMHTWIEKGLALDDVIYYHGGGKPLHILCAFRREVFDRALFDPNLGFHEDMEFLQRIATRPVVVDTEVRRCYPHTLREFARQQIWYGRTAPNYWRKVRLKKWWIKVIRSNAIIGFLLLSLLLMPFSALASLPPLAFMILIIVIRWLRRDVRFFGLRSIGKILDRFMWLLFREVCGRLCFDLGLIKVMLKGKHIELGR